MKSNHDQSTLFRFESFVFIQYLYFFVFRVIFASFICQHWILLCLQFLREFISCELSCAVVFFFITRDTVASTSELSWAFYFVHIFACHCFPPSLGSIYRFRWVWDELVMNSIEKYVLWHYRVHYKTANSLHICGDTVFLSNLVKNV